MAYHHGRSGSSSNSSSADNIATSNVASGSGSAAAGGPYSVMPAARRQTSSNENSRGSSSGASSSSSEIQPLQAPQQFGQQSHYYSNAHTPSSSNPNLLSPVSGAFPPSGGSGSSNNYSHINAPLPTLPTRRSSQYIAAASSSPSGSGFAADTTSAAIARGEIGANYSRYSTASLAGLADQYNRGQTSGGPLSPPAMHRSSSYATGASSTLLSVDENSSQEMLDQMPIVGAAHNRASRFSEYGLADNGSIESPSFRESTLYDSNTGHRESGQYYRNKNMEDTSLLWNEKNVEDDDFLHDPRTLQTAKSDRFWNFPTSGRGLMNALGIATLLGGFLALFMGWPIHTYVVAVGHSSWGWGLGATNSSGQIPLIPGLPNLIDTDTPDAIKNSIRKGFNGKDYQLVFSDEFNRDGRTFFPGDDPFWEAVDLNYWQTRDLEWYDPDAATTKGGKLEITLSEQPIHNLNFRSGMLQTWNKLCFNGGFYVEISASMPGDTVASGMWPGLWSMGNLGRAGYGATNDGMWPYSYNQCDVGTLAGQIFPNNTPAVSFSDSGQPDYRGRLSILAGQRASACTCPGQPHPGPNVNVGRGAPEIDILEAQVDWRGYGTASQSIQIAPFDYRWQWDNMTTNGVQIYNSSATYLNEWKGAATQESCSAVTNIGSDIYDGRAYQSFGYELTPGTASDSMITWAVGGKPTWSLKAGAFKPDARTLVGQREMSTEPMYLIMNLALSPAFQTLQFNRLKFPGVMRIDYVRVWQQKGKTDVTCDPKDRPTTAYIDQFIDYYNNVNITRWPTSLWPKNRLTGC